MLGHILLSLKLISNGSFDCVYRSNKKIIIIAPIAMIDYKFFILIKYNNKKTIKLNACIHMGLLT